MELLYKKEELRAKVCEALIPLIDNDFVFIDLPYYQNIGDVLIWNGTEMFLKKVCHKCLYRASFYTFDNRKLLPSTIIIMQGGGNWGDVWHEHNDFRLKIVQQYPNNKIIILPQTIYYDKIENLKSDMSVFKKHENLVVCARDHTTFLLLKDNLLNATILQLPDMAFFLDIEISKKKTGRTLFFKRADKEYNDSIKYDIVPHDADKHDWPTYEKTIVADNWIRRVFQIIRLFYPRFNFTDYRRLNDILYYRYLRHVYYTEGVKLLNQYDTIYSTRLHAAILGILLGKQVFFFDNSYGKNKNFYNTWLKDLDSISLITE